MKTMKVDQARARRFQRKLDRAGLAQVDFQHLVAVLTGQPGHDGHQVSRWCRGIKPIPVLAMAVLDLFLHIPHPMRQRLLDNIEARKGGKAKP